LIICFNIRKSLHDIIHWNVCNEETAKLGLGQLLSVQQVSVELTQVVGCLLTDRADAIKEFASVFLVVLCFLQLGKTLGVRSRAPPELVSHMCLALAT